MGIGHQRSRGIKSGVVTNLEAAEQAIRCAVDAAERMAGVTVESLIVSVTCGRLASESYAASVSLAGEEITDGDIGRVLAEGRRHSVSEGRAAVHSLPIGYSLDGEGGIAEPRGMVGRRLGVDMHVVTGDAPALANLELCINRCHLSVAAMVAAPYASGLSTLVDDEAELGCAVIDFGGGTTSIAVFSRGQFVHVDALAVGGHHITTDIARGLSTRIEDAERLKTVYGSALAGLADERDVLAVPPIGDEDERQVPNQVPRSALTRIIRAARRGDPRTGARPAQRLRLRRPCRPAHGAGRRRQPAQRPRRGGAPDSGAQRPSRPAAWHCRPARNGARARLRRRRRPARLSAGRRDGTVRRRQ